jgi:hypothetical protein
MMVALEKPGLQVYPVYRESRASKVHPRRLVLPFMVLKVIEDCREQLVKMDQLDLLEKMVLQAFQVKRENLLQLVSVEHLVQLDRMVLLVIEESQAFQVLRAGKVQRVQLVFPADRDEWDLNHPADSQLYDTVKKQKLHVVLLEVLSFGKVTACLIWKATRKLTLKIWVRRVPVFNALTPCHLFFVTLTTSATMQAEMTNHIGCQRQHPFL